MRCRPVIQLFVFVLSVAVLEEVAGAKTEILLVGKEIPGRLSIGARHVFFESDSLYLNGYLLQRNVNYSFNGRRGQFDLSRLEFSSGDTLRVTYELLPGWVQSSYGRSLPAVVPRTVDRSGNMSRSLGRNVTLGNSDISISGAKSFQFSARSAGGSDFSQSLDLRIQGFLAPEVEVIGSVSDRGYDPSYGPSNNRLSELERINLSLMSKAVFAQVGDIAVISRFDTGFSRDKRVSGANVRVHKDYWYAEALAARPKGRFESYHFFGIDGRQGPYQIGEGNAVSPIVPGSEQVWLDGRLLERGADKDYTVDYPTGQITFSVDHPIDRRSRVEVDYEPRATDYRGELFSTGAGARVGDSALFIALEFLREGDDKDRPLRGELSNEERELLATVGDSVGKAVGSGATLDSGGSYLLVVDSLPDTIYQYVGQGKGNYSVSFSFVGAGKGDYRFLGGDHYEFIGRDQGDYRPIVFLSSPERTDYYNARIGLRNRLLGTTTVEFRQTLSDRNLFSSRDDDNNRGLFYSVESKREWLWNGRENHLIFRGRRREANYKARSRLYSADFSRDFLLPVNFVVLSDESLDEIALSLSPAHSVILEPFFSKLHYRDSFGSTTGGFKTRLTPHRRVDAALAWKTIAARGKHPATTTDGKGRTYTGDVSYRVSSNFRLSTNYEHDWRENDYLGEVQGTRYDRYRWEFKGSAENLSYEYYVEDSLAGIWRQILSRNRVSAGSRRELGNLTSNVRLTYQWLTRSEGHDKSFLGRLHLQYHNAPKRLDVSASYTLSKETRNARGITYLEVEPGQGAYVLENGAYVPDPEGNYVKVEEILSNYSLVSRGEKSFHLSRDFKTVMIRFNSAIREELLSAGKRQLWWAIPFLSDDTQPYLFYSRRYDGDIRLLPLRSSHAVNVTFSEDEEIRNIAGAQKGRRDAMLALTLKQVVNATFVEESLELFESNRNNYFSGGGVTEGYRIGLTVRQSVASHEISTGSRYRRAVSTRGERSEIYSVLAGTRLRVAQRGELRSSLELYRQSLANTVGTPSFQLTDNKPGNLGAVWSADLRYGLKSGLRINLSVSGRHSDDRAARITGRGEMVVGF